MPRPRKQKDAQSLGVGEGVRAGRVCPRRKQQHGTTKKRTAKRRRACSIEQLASAGPIYSGARAPLLRNPIYGMKRLLSVLIHRPIAAAEEIAPGDGLRRTADWRGRSVEALNPAPHRRLPG